MGMLGYKTVLKLEGSKNPYELGKFSFSFAQPVGLDCKAQGEVRAGVMQMMFENLPTTELSKWMLMPRLFNNGCVVVYGENGMSVQRVFFENAKCVGMDIRYMESGKGYCMTHLVVQCQSLSVGGVSIENSWKNVTLRPGKDLDANLDLTSLIGRRPDGNVTADLQFPQMTEKYSLSQVNLSFVQDSDHFGEPQSEPYGGQILVTMDHIPSVDVLTWAAGSRSRKNGEIIFRNETETPPLRILFEDAYCVCFREETGNGASCSFTISPHRISLNTVMLDNNWEE